MIESYFGVPRAGKTWLATKRVLEEMNQGKRIVLTNYPVKHPKLGYTYKWTGRDMIHKVHTDAFIVIDEAYRDYDFRNAQGGQKFTVDEDYFFGTSGQNNIDVIVIAHSPIRVDPKIRDRCEMYHQISKQTLPIISWIWRQITGNEIILWFNDRIFLEEAAVSAVGQEPYATTMTFYRRSVSQAYDTHQFRDPAPNEGLEKWEPIRQEQPRQGIIKRIVHLAKKIMDHRLDQRADHDKKCTNEENDNPERTK